MKGLLPNVVFSSNGWRRTGGLPPARRGAGPVTSTSPSSPRPAPRVCGLVGGPLSCATRSPSTVVRLRRRSTTGPVWQQIHFGNRFQAKAICLFAILLNLFFASSSFALEKFVRVHVLSRYPLEAVEIFSPLAKLKVVDDRGRLQESLGPADQSIHLKALDRKVEVLIGSSRMRVNQIAIEPPRGSPLLLKAGNQFEKKFFGHLNVKSINGTLFFVEELPIEDYVRGVLEAELPQGFPMEAIKAQAVLIRTYALAEANRHIREGFNLCDLTHCQVYGGRKLRYRSLDEAAQATRGLILAYQNRPIRALYHSTCGGHTSANHRVFGGDPLPYLQGVSDENYCSKSPHLQWENSVSLKILEEVLKKDSSTHPKGEITNLKAAELEEDGRIFTLEILGKRNFKVPVVDFLSVVGRYLGWSQLKSNWFEVEVKEGEAHFKGRGLGHGVGFCQWGARGMAEAGKKFNEILQHYFPGTQLVER